MNALLSQLKTRMTLFPIIFSFFFYASAGAPDTAWTRIYGTAGHDCGYAVLQTGDNGFIIAGETTPSGSDFSDVYLIRTDETGDTLWTGRYGGDSADVGKDIQPTSTGGFIIVGSTRSSGAGYMDMFLVNIDSSGDTLWTKTYGGPDDDEGSAVLQTGDGGFIIIGTTSSFGAGSQDLYLVRTNAGGDTLWTRTYGGDSFDEGKSIRQTSDGGFIIGGSSSSLGSYNVDAYLVRINASGDTLWTTGYNVFSVNEYGFSASQTSDSGFVITGHGSFSGLYRSFLVHTDADGDSTLWTQMFGGFSGSPCRLFTTQQTNDGGYFIAGILDTFTIAPPLPNMYMIRTDADGATLWTANFGTDEPDYCYAALQTGDGGYILAGYTEANDAEGDVYLVRLNTEPTGAKKPAAHSAKINDFTLSCDRRSGPLSVYYTVPYACSVTLEAYDVKGSLVKVLTEGFMHKGRHSVTWDCRRHGSKIYFLRLRADGSAVSRKLMAIRY